MNIFLIAGRGETYSVVTSYYTTCAPVLILFQLVWLKEQVTVEM